MSQTKSDTSLDVVVLSLFAGGSGGLDEAVRSVVGPLVDEFEPERWSYVRWVDERGPSLRLRLAGVPTDAAEASAVGRIAALRDHVDAEREGLLPTPRSWRRGGREVGVERLAAGGGRSEDDEVDQASSALARLAVDELPGGPERTAFALAAMVAVAEIAVEPARRAAYWEATAQRWTGSDESAARVREGLAARAQRLQGTLVGTALSLRNDPRFADALTAHAERARDEDAAADLIHRTNNRLGVTPLEEALLAVVAAAVAIDADAVQETATEPEEEPATAPEPDATVVALDEVRRDGPEGEEPVLDGVSLEVHAGEVFGLLGPPGAGKSSLLGIASGLRIHSRGNVDVLGHDPRADREALRGRVGIPVPDSELAEAATPRENLDVRQKIIGQGSVDAALEIAGLREVAGNPFDELDPGARRRTGIAAALLSEPEVLFLDEPTDGLSAVEREAVWAMLRRRRDQGGTTILTTSSVQDVLSVCDRVALVLGGEIAAVGTGEEIAEAHFRKRSLHLQIAEEPDVALMRDLPDVFTVEVEERPDHWTIELSTLQPDELLKTLGADPDFPRVIKVSDDDLEGTFLRPGKPDEPITPTTDDEATTA